MLNAPLLNAAVDAFKIPDLRRKLMNYIRRYNVEPRPIRWRYVDVAHRITGPKRSFTRH